MKKINYKEKGITLVALVITIIILLILAGVTISSALGQSGLFQRAKYAGEKYKESEENEGTYLEGITSEIDKIINEEEYKEPSGANSPKMGGMKAVEYNEDGSTKNASKIDWYNYEEKRWANGESKDGSLWVWIPRYAYKISYKNEENKSEGGTIDIVFLEGKTNKDKNGKDVTSEEYIDEKGEKGAYIIHPAFRDGSEKGLNNGYANGEWDEEIEGFWMSKFEAGYAGELGKPETAKDSNIEYTTLKNWIIGEKIEDISDYYYGTKTIGTKIKYPEFKANRVSFNNISIEDAYNLSFSLKDAKEVYGFNNVDTHLMKNSEWGAMAYLTHSKYGRDKEEVMINNVSINGIHDVGENNIYAITGYAGRETSSEENITTLENVKNHTVENSFEWMTEEGQKASTTNNLYGIYDTSGGLFEFVTSYLGEGENYTENIGNLEGNNNKYKSKFSGNSETNTVNYNMDANKMIKGSAIWETSTEGTGKTSWNNDASVFVHTTEAFVSRGGHWAASSAAGIFCFNWNYGCGHTNVGFRVTII